MPTTDTSSWGSSNSITATIKSGKQKQEVSTNSDKRILITQWCVFDVLESWFLPTWWRSLNVMIKSGGSLSLFNYYKYFTSFQSIIIIFTCINNEVYFGSDHLCWHCPGLPGQSEALYLAYQPCWKGWECKGTRPSCRQAHRSSQASDESTCRSRQSHRWPLSHEQVWSNTQDSALAATVETRKGDQEVNSTRATKG